MQKSSPITSTMKRERVKELKRLKFSCLQLHGHKKLVSEHEIDDGEKITREMKLHNDTSSS